MIDKANASFAARRVAEASGQKFSTSSGVPVDVFEYAGIRKTVCYNFCSQNAVGRRAVSSCSNPVDT